MKYSEVKQDLFEVNTGKKTGLYCLAHCISADFGMFGGIVVGFNERWDMKNALIKGYGNVEAEFNEVGGFSIPYMVGNDVSEPFTVYNLITKAKVSHQPTLQDIKKALINMKINMLKYCERRIAMPKIGCGIDGQNWDDVSKIIKEVFENTDIEVLICEKEV